MEHNNNDKHELDWTPYNDIIEPHFITPPINDPAMAAGMSPTGMCNNPLYFMPVDATQNSLMRNIYGPYGPLGSYINVVSSNDLTGSIPAVSMDPLPRWGDFALKNSPPYTER